VGNYRLVPDRAGDLIGRPLAVAEVAAGALLALGLGVRPVATLLALFIVGFSVAVAVNLLRGRTIDCGCFGPDPFDELVSEPTSSSSCRTTAAAAGRELRRHRR
jgi:hypothetical protein